MQWAQIIFRKVEAFCIQTHRCDRIVSNYGIGESYARIDAGLANDVGTDLAHATQAEVGTMEANGHFDVAVINRYGFIKLVDRTKDVVKSGGECISSVEPESHAADYAGARRAAVIAVPDPRWGERPLLIVEGDDDAVLTQNDVIDHLCPLVHKYWLPDRVAFATLSLGTTGKIDKLALRRLFAEQSSAEVLAD